MANIINLYIETVDGVLSLDLFGDENISLNSSVQNIKDVSKIFTDFSQPFTIPASSTNNDIFKHYYNADVIGYNANTTRSAIIEINQIPFKKGKLKLLSAKMINGEVDSYTVTFVGELVKLSDSFGEDELNDLDLSALDHAYDHDTVKSMMAGSGDTIYPLISGSRNWVWNTQGTNLAIDDVRFGTNNEFGISYGELRPAIRLMKIIEAIEARYGITFSNDFFNTTSHFNELFIFANRENSLSDADSTLKYKKLIMGGETDFEYYLGQWRVDGDSFTVHENKWDLEIVPSSGSIPYSVMIDGEDEEEVTGTFSKQWSDVWNQEATNSSRFGKVHAFHNVQVKSAVPLSYTATIVVSADTQSNPRLAAREDIVTTYGPTVNASETTDIFISNIDSNGVPRRGILPNIKVKDFINGLINMFNLVIDPLSATSFKVQTLNDWYADGVENDLTSYVDLAEFTVKRPDLPKRINFQHEQSNTFLNKKYFDTYNRQYGDLHAEFDFDGSPALTIKLPFENVQGEMLVDESTGIVTDVHVTKLIDIDDSEKAKHVSTKPILFYMNQNDTPASGGISMINSGGTTEEIVTFNIAKNTNNLQNNLINQSTNFGDEFDTYSTDGVKFLEPNTNPLSESGNKYSLFSNYWEDYINDLYDIQRRVYNYTCILPVIKLANLKLNDKIILDDRRYIINNVKTNLTTGVAKMELLNDIYVNAIVSATTHAVVSSSSSRLTCNKPTVTLNGVESTGDGISYAWSTSGGGVISGATTNVTAIGMSAGTYTLTITDSALGTDNQSYVISDSRSTPSVTINASAPELSYTAQTITLSSSLPSGYVYNWSTSDGDIPSGATLSAITITIPGTYDLSIVENNTGCAASATTTVTAGDMELPTVPTGLYTSANTATSSQLTWTESTDDIAILNYDVHLDGSYYGTTPDSGTTLTITGLTSGTTIQLKVLARDTSSNVSDFSDFYYQRVSGDGADGADGVDSYVVKLISPQYIVTYDIDGLNPIPSTMELTATTQNIGTPWFKFTGDDIPNEGSFTPGTGNQDFVTYTAPSGFTSGATSEIVIEVSDGDQNELAQDIISVGYVKSGSDAYTVILSNDSHTLPTTNLGVVNYTGSGTDIIVYKGSVQLAGITTGTPTIGQYKVTASPTNITVGTLTPGTPLVVGDHNSMTQNNASIEFTINVEDSQTIIKLQTLSKSIEGTDGGDGTDGVDGADGTDALTVKLTADNYAITYDSAQVETPPSQSITFTGVTQNVLGPRYNFLREGVSKQNSTSPTYTIPDGDEPVTNGVVNYRLDVRQFSTVGTIVASDTVTVYGVGEGSGGLTFIMTNEAHILPADWDGTSVNYTGSGTKIYVYEGATQLDYNGVGTTPGTWSIGANPVNITSGITTDSGSFVTIGDHNSMTADQASIDYTIFGERLDGTSFTATKIQSFALSKSGQTGTDGTVGEDALKTTQGYVYYQISQASAPSTPSATNFAFSTYSFTGLTANWSQTIPTGSGGTEHWYSSFTAEEDYPAGSDEVSGVTFSTPLKYTSFTDLVAFVDLTTSGSTTIHGGNITTGCIKSAGFVTGTAPFSSNGTQFCLDDGTIEAENFAIDSGGSASFRGTVSASTVIGSFVNGGTVGGATITGGTIDIGTGAFKVLASGEVNIEDKRLMINGDEGGSFPQFLTMTPQLAGNDAISKEGVYVKRINYGGNEWVPQMIFVGSGATTATQGGRITAGFDGLSATTGGHTGFYFTAENIPYGGGVHTACHDDNTLARFANVGFTKIWFYGSGNIESVGNITAYVSDERLKTNLGNISTPLDKIDKLNGFEYQFNDLAKSFGYNDTSKQVGVSAQEMKEVLPEVVKRAPFDKSDDGTTSKSGEDYLTVHYDKIVPLLIEGIKELRQEVKDLRKQIKNK